MPDLSPRADLGQLRQQAKELLQAAKRADVTAVTRIRLVADCVILDSAQLAVAREHGFDSWAKLKTEINRRKVLDSRDATRLLALLAEHPELASERMLNWCDHPRGASPLGYVAMLRYDTALGVWRDVPGTGELARALLEAGAPVEGDPADVETPLMTAASYGDPEVARVLIEAGADLNATAPVTAGAVRGGTALRHAAVFGMTDVAEVLLAAGATDLVQAAVAGDITATLTADTPERDRVAALRIAAEHGRLDVIDQLLATSTPVDGVDVDGSTALHEAAFCGRAESVRHLLARGADPTHRDARFDATPLGWCRYQQEQASPGQGYEEVAQILAPITPDQPWPATAASRSPMGNRDATDACSDSSAHPPVRPGRSTERGTTQGA